MTPVAVALAEWAHDLQPMADDFALADRSLLDTVAVTVCSADRSLQHSVRKSAGTTCARIC